MPHDSLFLSVCIFIFGFFPSVSLVLVLILLSRHRYLGVVSNFISFHYFIQYRRGGEATIDISLHYLRIHLLQHHEPILEA